MALPRAARSATTRRWSIVHSLVSRSYIMDLRPGNSTVEYLLGEGFDVYMLDWGIPDERDADNTHRDVRGRVPRRARSRRCGARAAATR